VHDATIIEERGSELLKLILNEENVQDLSESVNAFMLAEGLALID